MPEPRFWTKNNRRTINYLVCALALEALGIFAIAPLLILHNAPSVWLELTVTALPGVVYTVFVPALRDLTKGVRTWAFVFLTLGVGVGLVILSGSVVGEDNYVPTVVVTSIALLITAVVAYVDWKPNHRSADAESPAKSGTATGSDNTATRVTLPIPSTPPAPFGSRIKWFLLCVVTIGIYGFWVNRRLQKWIVEHQELDLTS